jgi:hypothetical protein
MATIHIGVVRYKYAYTMFNIQQHMRSGSGCEATALPPQVKPLVLPPLSVASVTVGGGDPTLWFWPIGRGWPRMWHRFYGGSVSCLWICVEGIPNYFIRVFYKDTFFRFGFNVIGLPTADGYRWVDKYLNMYRDIKCTARLISLGRLGGKRDSTKSLNLL